MAMGLKTPEFRDKEVWPNIGYMLISANYQTNKKHKILEWFLLLINIH